MSSDMDGLCGGIGMVSHTDNDGNESLALYSGMTVDSQGNETFGLQLGCCGGASSCWTATVEVLVEDAGGGGRQTVTRYVAINPCDDHCRMPGPYENDDEYPVPYQPAGESVPDVQVFAWAGEDRSNIVLSHDLGTAYVVAEVTGDPLNREFICTGSGSKAANVATLDGTPVATGTTLTVTLRRGQILTRKFTWVGDGINMFLDCAHNFGSRSVNVQCLYDAVPSSDVGDPSPPIPFSSVVSPDITRIQVKTGRGDIVALPYGYVLAVTITYTDAILPGDDDSDTRRKSHQQFKWGGVKNMEAAESTTSDNWDAVTMAAMYPGQSGYYHPNLDGGKARIFLMDGTLICMVHSDNVFVGGNHTPALNWYPVTECMWSDAANYITGELPLDSDGQPVQAMRNEVSFDNNFFFTLPITPYNVRACSYVQKDIYQDQQGNPVDGLYFLWRKWFRYNETHWHARCNFEYRCAPDADMWLRNAMPYTIVGGSVYKMDQEMVNYIANEGASWFASATIDTPVPPLPASKLLLPTFPNQLPEPETENTLTSPAFLAWQQAMLNGTELPQPTEADRLNMKYPADENETITNEMRQFWHDYWGVDVSAWYRHPRYVNPDILSDETVTYEGKLWRKPFFDALTLNTFGHTARVLGFRIVEWTPCSKDHMCVKGIWPRYFTTAVVRDPCYPITDPSVVITEIVRTEGGGSYSWQMTTFPPYLNTGVWGMPKRPRFQVFQWTGDGILAMREFDHTLPNQIHSVAFSGNGTIEMVWNNVNYQRFRVGTKNGTPVPLGQTITITAYSSQ